ncbi:MAG: sodium:proton antiporter [Proteobacteria bacterium]|nr:sodium:proton antiporter [Pseudomonadota bacterium]
MSFGIVLDLISLLLVSASVFGLLNHHFFKLPHTIGLVILSLLVSGTILLVHAAFPAWGLADAARGVLTQIDFSETLLLGLLSFLLFAGALHIDLPTLMANGRNVVTLVTIGTILSTAIVAAGVWAATAALKLDIPFIYCVIFGALISPTDPVAVLAILKKLGLPKQVETEIIGESLFNDGVAIVIFTIAVSIATGTKGDVGVADIATFFAVEAFGGIALGALTGYLAFLALRSIDDYVVEVIITLALVMATYGIATRLHVSGPLAVVVAGLLIGNPGARLGMSEKTREHLFNFWEMMDEILNSVLFVLIGFEVLALSLQPGYVTLALLMIPLVLVARVVSVGVPLYGFGMMRGRARGSLALLTWGGLHGAISVALVLALPTGPIRDMFLPACYTVVIFSIVVQGLTLEHVARRFGPKA